MCHETLTRLNTVKEAKLKLHNTLGMTEHDADNETTFELLSPLGKSTGADRIIKWRSKDQAALAH
eukprot:9921150-Ditylum_brightwellii.AAC.1